MRGLRLLLLLGASLCAFLAVERLRAAPTPAQRAKLRDADDALKRAVGLSRSKKIEEAVTAAAVAQKAIGEVATETTPPDVIRLAAPLHKRLVQIRAELEKKGAKLDPLPDLPAGQRAGAKGGKAAVKSESVSFTREIAPFLVAKCGGCHVQKKAGGLSMASYASLIRGGKDGVVISPKGDGKGSAIVEAIESGDMPRGGGKVTPQELTALTEWINQGFKFDGDDPTAMLTSLTGKPDKANEKPKVTITRASGKEEVQFARDIGPILLENCTGCHAQQNPPRNFSMANFRRLMEGGQAGTAITPGMAEQSLIIQKLRGTAKDGAQMPLNASPLDEATIAKIATWINLQARFDGDDPTLKLADLVARVAAESATHEQLSQKRVALAAANWRVALPDAKPSQSQTKNFLLYGAVGDQTLSDVATAAEIQVDRLSRALKLSVDEPLVKGRVTLYVFDKHYDYGEIGERLEKRTIPGVARGHWTYSISDAYACVMPPEEREYSLSALLHEQIAGLYFASLGRGVPRWYAVGAGRAMAAKQEPKDPRIKAWDSAVPAALAASLKPADFFDGSPSLEDADVLSYAFVKALSTQGARQTTLLTELANGTAFDVAFRKGYGASPKDAASAWMTRAAAMKRK